MSDIKRSDKKMPINTLTFIVLIAMVFKRKKSKKKKKEEEPQIGFQGGAWDQAQPPQPGFTPEQPEPEGQTPLTYICPHCQDKFTADRPFQSLLVACPKCNGQSVIDPVP